MYLLTRPDAEEKGEREREWLVCSLATAILVAAASFDSLNETMRILVNFYIEGKVTATLL